MFKDDELEYLLKLRKDIGEQHNRALFFNDGSVKPSLDTFFAAASNYWERLIIDIRTLIKAREQQDLKIKNLEKTIESVIVKRDALTSENNHYRSELSILRDSTTNLLDRNRNLEGEVRVLEEKLKVASREALARGERNLEMTVKMAEMKKLAECEK